MKTEYKGMLIKTVLGVYTVMGKEYASLAGAKGAITRMLNAKAAQEEASAPIRSHGNVEISADDVKQMQDALLPCPVAFTAAKNDKGDLIAANPKTAQVYAELDYYGMAKARDTRSRNKREGKFVGKTEKRKVRAGACTWVSVRKVSSFLAHCVKT